MLEKSYAEVYVNINILEANKPFHYSIPKNIRKIIKCGHKVLVPFGNTTAEGFVTSLIDKTEIKKIKDIIEIVNKDVIIPEHLIELGKWMSRRYICLPAKVFESFIPPGVRTKISKIVSLNPQILKYENFEGIRKTAPLQWKILNLLKNSKEGYMDYDTLKRKLQPSNVTTPLKKLEEKEFIIIDERIETGVNKKMAKHAVLKSDILAGVNTLIGEYRITSKYQKQILDCVLNYRVITISDLAEILNLTYSQAYSSVRALEKKGLIDIEDRELRRDPYLKQYKDMPPVTPTEEQKNVIKLIRNYFKNLSGQKVLIHGVTGSGKTEIYIKAAEQALKTGKSAIILVPEISLAAQMIEIFKNRFGYLVAIYHSRLSAGERYDEWYRILNGEAKIIVGARSAIFAPVKDLGVIVIDEEHETTYKQDEDPKYHTREVAEKRVELENALLILGSATPAIETYYKSERGLYTLYELKKRVLDKPLPVIELVDMRQEIKSNNRSIFSRKLLYSIKEALNNNEQIILFLNRRGYSTFVLCRDCGFVMKCPHCDISLTYHYENKILKCHYCGYERNTPDLCPSCKGRSIRYFGIGTQRIEMEVKKYFPDSRILRMDVDSTKTKGSHEKILDLFKNRGADILVGTQMITKGLDFPGVSLVGVVTADTCLNLPDFRAGERTFQLITQVAGRSGRGDVPGLVIVQTYNPRHYSLKCAVNHDYDSFFNKEIIYRRELDYPPFSDMMIITIKGSVEKDVSSCALQLGVVVKHKYSEMWKVTGPSPAALYRIKNLYRWQMAVKRKNTELGVSVLLEIIENLIKKFPNVGIELDVNPFSVL